MSQLLQPAPCRAGHVCCMYLFGCRPAVKQTLESSVEVEWEPFYVLEEGKCRLISCLQSIPGLARQPSPHRRGLCSQNGHSFKIEQHAAPLRGPVTPNKKAGQEATYLFSTVQPDSWRDVVHMKLLPAVYEGPCRQEKAKHLQAPGGSSTKG